MAQPGCTASACPSNPPLHTPTQNTATTPITRQDPFHGLGPAQNELADRAFTRAAGAPLVHGNRVRLLRDAGENYPAWLEAIAGAERWIHFESYIIHDDDTGGEFADALCRKAREGVSVRVLYDWMGGLNKAGPRFWRRIRDAGVDVRCFNPFRITSPFAWIHRDHRKMLGVDGRVGYITGLCVGDAWTGDAAKGVPPWRDAGIEVIGPAVADIEWAFRRVWREEGDPVPHDQRPRREEIEPSGDVALRVVASEPWSAGIMRLDALIAAAARERLWLADAYFAGLPSYVQALRSAALDGVDVRLLVPGGSDIPMLRPLSMAGYRPLLEAGVRVFEWNGSMMHAKTAVADGRWSRVGSTNLNIASFIGNYELDAAIEDATFGEQMEQAYLIDLENATEIVLGERRRWRDLARWRGETREHRTARRARRASLAAGGERTQRATASALRIGGTLQGALTQQRQFGQMAVPVLLVCALVLAAVAVVTFLWPRILAWPLALTLAWAAFVLGLQGWTMWRRRRRENSTDRAPQGSA